MKSLPARVIVAASCIAGTATCGVGARTCSLESLSCLFDLARPLPIERAIRFSFLPLAESLSIHRANRPVEPVAAEVSETTENGNLLRTEFTTSFIRHPQERGSEEETFDEWPFFHALRHWQSNPEVAGLSHNLINPHSFVALDYSDIFETGRAPYKGGHGVSLFLRHEF